MMDDEKNANHGIGWVQVNNTVVPIIQRTAPTGQAISLVPLPVIQHAAGLLTNAECKPLMTTKAERVLLCDMCSEAGIPFQFPVDTELILLNEIDYIQAVRVAQLPNHDPFTHAQFAQGVPRLSGSGDDDAKEMDEKSENAELALLANEAKPTTRIWRPISFSPDVTAENNKQSKSEHDCSEKITSYASCSIFSDVPLDLSTK